MIPWNVHGVGKIGIYSSYKTTPFRGGHSDVAMRDLTTPLRGGHSGFAMRDLVVPPIESEQDQWSCDILV